MQASLAVDDFDDSTRRRAREIARAARRDRCAPNRPTEFYLQPQKHRAELEKRIMEALRDRFAESELLLCLFSASLYSYRRGTICEPFPPFFEQGERAYDDVEMFLGAFPNLESMVANPQLVKNMPPQALSLLDWILNPEAHSGFSIQKVTIEQYESDLSASSGRSLSTQSRASRPDFVFKVNYSATNQCAAEFESVLAEFGALSGYHGSGTENFHSIIHNGLDDTFSRSTSIFGEGVYLSEDRDVGYSFVKAGKVALGSHISEIFGEQFGMLACCQVAKHPQVRHSHSQSSTRYRDSAILVDGQNQLPPGYIVVTQPQHVLIRYILVYTNKSAGPLEASQRKSRIGVCQFMFLFYLGIILLLAYFKYRNSVMFITLRHSLGL